MSPSVGILRCALLTAAAILVSAGAASAQPDCYLSYVWTVSDDDANLRRVALDGGTVEETIAISLPATPISGITGIAIEPTTGVFFLLLEVSAPNGAPLLVTHDALNGITTPVGNTLVPFTGLTFRPNGELFAIEQDNASGTVRHCILDLVFGTPIDICLYANADAGEAMAADPTTDLMFHASGSTNVVFEAEDPMGVTPCDALFIDVSGTPLVGNPVSGIAYQPSVDGFVWAQSDVANSLYAVSKTGVVTALTTANHTISDIEVVEVATPCPPSDEFIRGDANNDGSVNIADVISLLGSLFAGDPPPVCPDAGDFNDDGGQNIADAITLLGNLFSAGPPLPPPFPNCGEDGTPNDALDCPTSACP